MQRRTIVRSAPDHAKRGGTDHGGTSRCRSGGVRAKDVLTTPRATRTIYATDVRPAQSGSGTTVSPRLGSHSPARFAATMDADSSSRYRVTNHCGSTLTNADATSMRMFRYASTTWMGTGTPSRWSSASTDAAC